MLRRFFYCLMHIIKMNARNRISSGTKPLESQKSIFYKIREFNLFVCKKTLIAMVGSKSFDTLYFSSISITFLYT